jgi:hypothetical protein
LDLESPQDVRFSVFNTSTNLLDLQLHAVESSDEDLIVQSFEQGSDFLGKIQPGEHKEIVLRLFALRQGVLPVTGIVVWDNISGREV